MALPNEKKNTGGLTVLLVENYDDTLLYLSQHLEESGHTVIPARTVAEALQILRSQSPDVLLCDIHLPDGSGWEVPAAAGKRLPRLCVAISGYVMASEISRSKEAGFHQHLVKPFLPSQLDALLARVTHPAGTSQTSHQ